MHPRPAAPSAGSNGNDTSEVRAWARANGYEVNERGRIPAAIIDAYEAEH